MFVPLYLSPVRLSAYLMLVKVLLERGADVATAEDDRWKPPYYALDNGHVVVRLLNLPWD